MRYIRAFLSVSLIVTLLSACGGMGVASTSSPADPGSSGAGTGNPGGGSSSGGSDPANAQIIIDGASNLAPISADEIGTNLAVWYDVTASDLPAQVAAVKPHILRWPGGSTADTFHWQGQTECSAKGTSVGAFSANSTFDNFMSHIVTPGGYEGAITVNYGSNIACTAGGDPTEAAAWVAYAKSKGYNAHVHHWTVGNEVYGGWEFDLHAVKNDPTTYANAVAAPGGFYALMKAADATAQIGVVVTGAGGWDSIVLKNATYDYVELHWYAQQPGQETDHNLLFSEPGALANALAALHAELDAAGKGSTPIMLGEFNSVTYNQGKQTVSIVNALFTGMAFGEVLNNNVAVATWWFGAGATQVCNTNNSASLYGWQNFGAYDLVAANTRYSWTGCGVGPVVPESTVFPSGTAFALVSQFAVAGNHMLGVAVNPSLTDVRAYAATQAGGYAVMLFNLNSASASTVMVVITSAAANSFTATTSTYGKLQYDNSRNNVWTGPVQASLGNVGTTTTVTLPPWSITVLLLQ